MFVAREKELALIRGLLSKKSGSIMIYGKRKVGKTTLITHALEESTDKTVYYECLKSTMEDNIEGFVTELVRAKVLPVPLSFRSFPDIFAYLNTLDETFNIVIDEYPYLKILSNPATVDSVFQSVIDNNLRNIRLFISGSHVGMMKDMLEEKNALYGRFIHTVQLKELNYSECAEFYQNLSAYDKVGFYSVFGGSPYINEFIDPRRTLRDNIIDTILNNSSPVYHYAEQLLISDFTNSIGAERIFYAISNGKLKYGEIESKLGMKNNGLLSKQLSSLIRMDIVAKTFPINKPDDNKKCAYEINDNLLRFYYTFVYKNKSALQVLGAEAFYEEYVQTPLITFISRRYEEICRTYFSLLVQARKVRGVTNIGTYYYDDSETRTNGEFDVVLERKDAYDIYEVKYYSRPLSVGEMLKEKEQVNRIKGLNAAKLGFISASGFESIPDEFDCIPGDDIYSI